MKVKVNLFTILNNNGIQWVSAIIDRSWSSLIDSSLNFSEKTRKMVNYACKNAHQAPQKTLIHSDSWTMVMEVEIG